MANERKYQPHLKEAQMSNSLKNLANAVKSNATNLTNLKMANANLAEQLKVALAQKKVLTNLRIKKIYSLSAENSDNQNPNKHKRTDKTRGIENRMSTEEKHWDPLGCFWACRYEVELGHINWTCRTASLNKNHNKEETPG